MQPRKSRKLAPEIETRLGPFPERQELAPHEERLLFFDAVVQVFSNIARTPVAALLCRRLALGRSRHALAAGPPAAATARTSACSSSVLIEKPNSIARIRLLKSLVDWNRERLITRIALRRFNESETGDQLGALLGENVSGEFAVAVHRETEGNPFFVEEVLEGADRAGLGATREWKVAPLRHGRSC